MNQIKLRQMLEDFFIEDIGENDVTSQTIFPLDQQGEGVFVAKASGVIAGMPVIEEAYRLLDPKINVTFHFQEGDWINTGDRIVEVNGPVRQLLTGERVILNVLQRMSGIASVTKKSVDALNDAHITICDTRKTAPGLRMLDKYAVNVGGGRNHRIGLYDGVMIKDNHISFCGSIAKAVQAVRDKTGHMVKIEVETENEAQVLEAVNAGADIIMFDNRTPDEVEAFSEMVPDHILTEASGGIMLENLPSYANTGVDVISLGFLTHSVTALDISLLVNVSDE